MRNAAVLAPVLVALVGCNPTSSPDDCARLVESDAGADSGTTLDGSSRDATVATESDGGGVGQDAAFVDASGAALVDAGTGDASGAIPCIVDGVCQPACASDPDCAAALTCLQPSSDDGTAAAATLGPRSLDCVFRDRANDWPTAMLYCARFGAGYRLPTKAEALKIAADRSICRPLADGGASIPAPWVAWTSTCAGNELAYYMSTNMADGSTVGCCTYTIDIYHGFDDAPRTLCIRP